MIASCQGGISSGTTSREGFAVINILIYLIVVFLVIGVAWWLIDYIPVPAPLNRIAKIVVIVIGALVIIMALLNLTGTDIGFRGPVR